MSNPSGQLIDVDKIRFDYAWKYFDFHAKQRTTMLNFFILFAGLFTAACVQLFNNNHYFILYLASIFFIVLTVIFIFLERRNEELAHIAEDVLRNIEKDIFRDATAKVKWPRQRNLFGKMREKEMNIPLGILARQDYDENNGAKSKYSHGDWIPVIHCVMIIVYALFAVAAWALCYGCKFFMVLIAVVIGIAAHKFLKNKGLV